MEANWTARPAGVPPTMEIGNGSDRSATAWWWWRRWWLPVGAPALQIGDGDLDFIDFN